MKSADKTLIFVLGIIVLAAVSGLGSSAIIPGAVLVSALFYCLFRFSRNLVETRRAAYGWLVACGAILVFVTAVPLGRGWMSQMIEPFVIRSLENRLKRNPDETVTLQHLSTIYTTRRNETAALSHIEKLLRKNPCDALALSNRALLHRFGARFEESLRDSKAAVHCDSSNARLWDQLGFAYAAAAKPDSARAAFEIALGLSSGEPERARFRKHMNTLEKPR